MDERLFTERDLRELERDYAEGLSSRQILDLFNARGIKFSEATFRKYIQLGLLPRSKRVGRKGKFRGSQGIYPAGTIRRIVAIKRMMSSHYTIEDIQRSFGQFKETVDSVENQLNTLFDDIEEKLHGPRIGMVKRKQLARELLEARRAASELMRRLTALEQQVGGPVRSDVGPEGVMATPPSGSGGRASRRGRTPTMR